MAYKSMIKQLAEELDELRAKVEAWGEYTEEEKKENEDEEPTEEDTDRIKDLTSIEDELGDLYIFDRNGGHLIPDCDFEDYAREQAEQCGIEDFSKWPLTCIDWKEAAAELESDYSTIEIDGETYYYQEP